MANHVGGFPISKIKAGSGSGSKKFEGDGQIYDLGEVVEMFRYEKRDYLSFGFWGKETVV